MPDDTPPPVPEGTVCPAPQVLNPEQIDAVLADFRSWLERQAAFSRDQQDTVPAEAETTAPPDLYTLLAQFTALRHEVNLQTRASRVQQEQNAETLRQLSQALETLSRKEEEARERQDAADEEILRPLLKTLVDLYDALGLARREIQRVRDVVLPELEALRELPQELTRPAPEPEIVQESMLEPEPEPELARPRRSFWGWLFGASPVPPVVNTAPAPNHREQEVRLQQIQQWQARLQQSAAGLEQSASRVQQMLTSLLTGYTMSLQRLERALQQYELEPMAVVGEPFDPEQMEAVEVVVEPGREEIEVIEEVRRGYLWQGRVFRFAQVRVARPEPDGNNHE